MTTDRDYVIEYEDGPEQVEDTISSIVQAYGEGGYLLPEYDSPDDREGSALAFKELSPEEQRDIAFDHMTDGDFWGGYIRFETHPGAEPDAYAFGGHDISDASRFTFAEAEAFVAKHLPALNENGLHWIRQIDQEPRFAP